MWAKPERLAMAAEIRDMACVMGDDPPCDPLGKCYEDRTRKVWVMGEKRGRRREPGQYVDKTYVVFKCVCGLGRVSWVFGHTKITCNARKSSVLALADRIAKAQPYKQFNPSNFKV